MTTPSANQGPKSTGLPVRVYLVVLAVVAVLPLVVFMVFEVIGAKRRAEEDAQDIVTRIAESSRFLLDNRMEAGAARLTEIAKTLLIRSNDVHRIALVLRNFREANSYLGSPALLDLEGRVAAGDDDADIEAVESFIRTDWLPRSASSPTQ